MIKIVDKALCCGCGACAQACPTGCVAMRQDSEGFLYPSVDAERCIACGRCEAVCPILNADRRTPLTKAGREAPAALGGWIRDGAVREASSSGGAFTLFANEILRRGGVVFGAVLEGRAVRHAAARCERELSGMRGSKYVQSAIGDTYRQVKAALAEGRPVLFTGTPCQTAGLTAYLGKRDENLYLVDFICHGVPSPKVFSAYLDSIEHSEGSRITAFSFREKDKGWHASGMQMGTRVKLENGREIRRYPAVRDSYMNGFLEDIYLRPSCYECRFKTIPKWGADITIADFWGINGVLPELNDGRGTSLVLIHGEHGMGLFDAVRNAFNFRECDWRMATVKNPTLLHSAKRQEQRERFFEDFEAHGYDYAARRYMSTGKTAVRKISRMLGHKLESTLDGAVAAAARVLHIRLTDDMRARVLQFFKFCMVGVTNVAVSYLVNIATLFLLGALWPGLKYDYMIANTTAFLVAVYWSFFWNSRKVFHFSTRDKALRRKALLKSYMCYGFSGIIVNNVLSTIWINVLGISKLVAPLLNLLVTIPLNYFTNKKWAFAEGKKGKP